MTVAGAVANTAAHMRSWVCVIRSQHYSTAEQCATHHLVVRRLWYGVTRVRVLGMWARPDVDLVLRDCGVRTGLVRSRVVVGHVEPRFIHDQLGSIFLKTKHTRMIEAIDPQLRVGLCTVNRTDVVRLAEVVPCGDLDEVETSAVSNDVLPARVVQMGVGVVDPLHIRIVRFGLVVPPNRI